LQAMAYLIVRREKENRPRSSAHSMAGRQYNIDRKGRTPSQVTSGSIMEFTESIRNTIDGLLGHLGFEVSIVFGEGGMGFADHGADKSVQALANAIRYWTDLGTRISYLTMHCDSPPGTPSSASTVPTSPSQTIWPGSTFSLPFHSYLPSSHETNPSPTGFRRTSYAAHQAANRASVSTLSSVDLGTPWDIIRATSGLVQM
jgi:hypothetical protein